MAAKGYRTGGSSKRLGVAMTLLFAAAVLLFLLLDGHVYRTTQGAEVGLYATIAVLFAGVVLAASACYLALTSLFRGRRRLENIVELESRAGRKARTKDQKAA